VRSVRSTLAAGTPSLSKGCPTSVRSQRIDSLPLNDIRDSDIDLPKIPSSVPEHRVRHRPAEVSEIAGSTAHRRSPVATNACCRERPDSAIRATLARTEQRTERRPIGTTARHVTAHLERIKAPSRSRRRKATRTSCSASVSFAAVVSSCRDAVGTCCDNRTRRCSALAHRRWYAVPSSCSTPSDSVVAH
jgi:hypothetical protein